MEVMLPSFDLDRRGVLLNMDVMLPSLDLARLGVVLLLLGTSSSTH